MSTLRGIVVQLNTGLGKHSGTDDMIYVGVSGTAGGREFPLDVAWFDDFERRSRVKYALGEVWEGEATVGAREPKMARGDWNDPTLFFVGFPEIDRVYLRKQTGQRSGSDDAWELDEVEITLYGESPAKRVFRSTTAIWLGVQYGDTVWVPEVGAEDRSVSLRA